MRDLMRDLTRCLFLLLCFFYSLNSFAQNPLASRVLVVYDPNSPDSVDVANHYVTSRAIPAANRCTISPPRTATTLSWPVFVSTTKTPIQNCLNAAGPDQILYLVLAYIRPFAVTAQNGKLYALDQYLADIWDQNDASDPFPYPDQNHVYFAAAQPRGNSYRPFISLSNYRAQSGARRIYSVWRLDAVTAALAKGLVDQAIAAETNGLKGQACLDRRLGAIASTPDSGYGSGDWQLRMAADFAGQAGFSVAEDSNPAEFGTPPAPNCPNAALYSGWYKLNHYNDAFTWNTGAIGFHLDSLSAMDPRGGPNWSANALNKGITVTSGAMAEPFLQGLPQPDGVFSDLFQGAVVGDAFLRHTAWLKWMILNIGDPLYLPFPGGLPPFNGPNPQASLALNPQFPVGPAASTGTVTLTAPAPAGGTMVNLSSSRPSAASVPASIVVPAGATSANFNIVTTAVQSDTFVLISTSGGINQSETLGVVQWLGGIFVISTSVMGGSNVTVAVVLNDVAPAGGRIVALTTSNPSALPVPATVTVPQGSSKSVFNVTSNPVSSNTAVTLTASLNGTTNSISITLKPALACLNLSHNTVVSGSKTGATAMLTGPAYAGGVTLTLSSSDSSVATVPGSVTVPQGATSVAVPVTTFPVPSSTPVTIAASSNGTVKSATLTVTPPAVTALSLSPATVRGGQTSTATVKLSGPAPSGGSVVSLSSSNQAVAPVASSITIPQGMSAGTFKISTAPVGTSTVVQITATYNATKTATLTVTP
jgi:uncharacterized protein (TIGR03790 family)